MRISYRAGFCGWRWGVVVLLGSASFFCGGCGGEPEMKVAPPTPTPIPMRTPRPSLDPQASSETMRQDPAMMLQVSVGAQVWRLSDDGEVLVEAGGSTGFQLRRWDVDSGTYVVEAILHGVEVARLGGAGDALMALDPKGRLHRVYWNGKTSRLPAPKCRGTDFVMDTEGRVLLAGVGCAALYESEKWTEWDLPELEKVMGLSIGHGWSLVAGGRTDEGVVARAWLWPSVEPAPREASEEGVLHLETGVARGVAQHPTGGGGDGPLDSTAGPTGGGDNERETHSEATPSDITPTPDPELLRIQRLQQEGVAVVLEPAGRPGDAPPTFARVMVLSRDEFVSALEGNGLVRYTFEPEPAVITRLPLADGAVDARFSESSRTLLMVTRAGDLHSMALSSGKVRRLGRVAGLKATRPVEILSLSRDGKRILLRRDGLALLDVELWRWLPPLPSIRGFVAHSLQWDPAGKTLFGGFSRLEGERVEMCLVRWAPGEDLAPLNVVTLGEETIGAAPEATDAHRPGLKAGGPAPGPAASVTTGTSMPMATSRDAGLVAVRASGGVKLLDGKTLQSFGTRRVAAVVGVGFDTDRETVYVVSGSGEVRRFEVGGDSDVRVTQYPGGVTAVASNAQLGLLAIGLEAASGGHGLIELLDPMRSQVMRRIRTPSPARRLTISGNGQLVAAALEDGRIGLWAVPSGWRRGYLSGGPEAAVAVGEKGRNVLFGEAEVRRRKLSRRRVSGRGSRVLRLTSPLEAVAFHPRGRCAVASERSGGIVLFDMRGRVALKLAIFGPDAWVFHTPDGEYFGSIEGEKHLRVDPQVADSSQARAERMAALFRAACGTP